MKHSKAAWYRQMAEGTLEWAFQVCRDVASTASLLNFSAVCQKLGAISEKPVWCCPVAR
jgi:hypothetical protein